MEKNNLQKIDYNHLCEVVTSTKTIFRLLGSPWGRETKFAPILLKFWPEFSRIFLKLFAPDYFSNLVVLKVMELNVF